MTNQAVIENKISSIQKYLGFLGKYKGVPLEKIVNDVTILGAIERYLYLVSQSAIDLAEALISLKGYRKPSTFAESFTILFEHGLISSELESNLRKMAGFRNALAHGYERIDYDILYDVLQNRLSDVEAFVKKVKDSI